MGLLALAARRLQPVALVPEFESALRRLAEHDDSRPSQNPQWGLVIPTIQRLLGGTDEAIAPFLAAWSLMYAVIVRLDHLQDGDLVDDPLPTANRPEAQYNLIFGYYVLATGVLDLLSPDQVPAERILRLRRLWTDMLLRMAGGQQRDLIARDAVGIEQPLDYYQQIAQAKTGATFALAFGGTAALLTDDPRTIDALTLIGEIYGTLLQYRDDLLDALTQPNPTLTLPEALTTARPVHLADRTGHTPAAFWAYLYRVYHEQVGQALVGLPAELQQGLRDLFARTFELNQDRARDAA
jgi:hypothetical protein